MQQELNKSYKIVRSKEDVLELMKHIEASDIIAYDTETDSLNMRKGSIVGWSVSGDVGMGYYLPTQVWNTDTQTLDEYIISGTGAHKISKTLLPMLKGKRLVMHNASFDTRFTKNYYGVDLLEDLWVDTALLVHTVYEEGAFGYGNPFGLKSIAIMNQEELGLNAEEDANKEQIELKESIKANGGEVTKVNFEIYKADLDILGKYAAADTDLTLRICNLYLERLRLEGLEKFFFEEEVMPIYKEVTVPMEDYGVDLDMELLHKTNEEIKADLDSNRKIVMDSILKIPEAKNWVIDTALREFPPNNKGNWAQELVKMFSVNLPRSEKTGKFSLTQKRIEALEEEDCPANVKNYLLSGDLEHLEANDVLRISTNLWKEKNDGDYINIQSKKHLGEIVFNYIGEQAISKTSKGQDQFDMGMLEELSKKYQWAENLRIYNKLLKIKSTYVDRFLEGAEDGRYYFYFKQNGTVSGRYGSDAQQLPKPKEDGEDAPIIVRYTNLVRAFLTAGKGRKVIDADYESLEPHCFASVSGDEKLREIFNKNHDFYSTVAIQTEQLEGVSADKKADNYLKKVNPVKRNQAKAYSLGIAYGMEAYALGKTLDIPTKEAEKLVEGYLNGFPELKEWRINSREQVKNNGFIKNKVGRIRHLPKVKRVHEKFGEKILDWRFRKELENRYDRDKIMKVYRDYRNGLNNCLNFQLQSLAAAVVNRAAVQINRKAKELGFDAIVQAQVHDQLIINVREDQAEEFAPIVQKLMEETTQLEGVTLKAPPEIADNWKEGH
jgi:DNA polymerase I-like protein with 3'-5' exonuclease and polymerase domains